MGKYSSIVVLTGAGVSAESGLKTFRDSGGLWEGHRVEDVATPEAYYRHPKLVHEFYNLRRQQLVNEATPNIAHRALAEFEQQYAGDFLLVTQNVDNLHEQAGSTNIVHMHGELLKLRCTQTGKVFDVEELINTGKLPSYAITTDTHCPCCDEPNNLRPDIVWFGEIPFEMDRIMTAIQSCDLFVSIGTSGNVYPAAGFVRSANDVDAHTVELNLEPSEGSRFFSEAYHGPATRVVPAFLQSI